MCLTKEKSFYRDFFGLYVPLVLYNVVLFGVNLADNVMIGAYSETALSGVAAVNQIQFIFQQVIISAGDAVVVLGSQYWGAHRKNEIKHIACGALYVGAGLGLLLFFWVQPFLRWVQLVYMQMRFQLQLLLIHHLVLLY